DEHKGEFVDPRALDIEYIRLTPKNFEDRVEIRDEDLRQRYEEQRDQLVEEEQLLVSKISFKHAPEEAKSSETKPEEAKTDASKADDKSESKLSPDDKKRQVAQTVIDRVKKGEKFEDLAKQLSEDTDTKDKGGDLGWRK